MLEKEFQYYLRNQKDLVDKHNGKWLLIQDEIVIGVFDTKKEAFDKSQADNLIGKALIQFCSPGDSAYTQTFHSRVYVQK